MIRERFSLAYFFICAYYLEKNTNLSYHIDVYNLFHNWK
ncbi:hypothetical protein BTBSAS_60021 [Brochothrix thermosphacta]|uniref:Uncharacterized protein n=1 Tax=Brochothrix thermosphacta TaxID=2756 RepID=A0A2X0QZI0_BROTH|nr:hypothetical protein BTBSAS_60021 [Brochothrix thermosphacta]